jgi:hypothetical protein
MIGPIYGSDAPAHAAIDAAASENLLLLNKALSSCLIAPPLI